MYMSCDPRTCRQKFSSGLAAQSDEAGVYTCQNHVNYFRCLLGFLIIAPIIRLYVTNSNVMISGT